jgi:heme-degrading monooxygenase HmoA
MVEVIWEFVVHEAGRGRFELAFGPGGAWSKLFSRCPGFRGTTVLRDTQTARRYLVVDLWDAAELRQQALADHAAEYADLEATLGQWIESRADLGVFSVLADATVRPRGGAAHSRARWDSRRTSR